MIITCIIVAVNQNIKDDPGWDLFSVVVALGIAAKAFSHVILIGNYREAAIRMITAVGSLMALFASFELGKGLSIGALAEAAPELAIVGIGFLAKKFPRTISITVFAVTAALLYVILQKGYTVG